MINKCMYRINVKLSTLLIRDFYPAPFCIFYLQGNAILYFSSVINFFLGNMIQKSVMSTSTFYHVPLQKSRELTVPLV